MPDTLDARWPPPPHDPRERELVGNAGVWEVRQFPASDPKLAYFAARGFLHLQLWEPQARISVLTPSRLTGGHYEAWTSDGRLAVRRWDDIRASLDTTGVATPGARELAALERWLVTRAEPASVSLLRAWWAAPAMRRS